MGINIAYWNSRILERSDISTSLVHLTKSTYGMDCLQVLLKILNDKKLIGSTHSGFIQGSEKAVCFQDAPLTGIAQNVRYEERLSEEGKINKRRYYAYGLTFNKTLAYRRGARPVIYEAKEEAKQKFKNELWRVVTLDLHDDNNLIDWTHEREWRVKGDFYFELEDVVVLLPNPDEYRRFITTVDPYMLSRIAGIVITGMLVF
ncbi:DUF2971 domain-containing protein [Lysinibacillus sp. BNK-21]|uniref:DUF2971 domain-containing protein n=1 Tax=Lysinibacillus sp. BNK-21 TaxID=3376156 RepID=UPI003B42F498